MVDVWLKNEDMRENKICFSLQEHMLKIETLTFDWPSNVKLWKNATATQMEKKGLEQIFFRQSL